MAYAMLSQHLPHEHTRLKRAGLKSGCKGTAFFLYMQIFCCFFQKNVLTKRSGGVGRGGVMRVLDNFAEALEGAKRVGKLVGFLPICPLFPLEKVSLMLR